MLRLLIFLVGMLSTRRPGAISPRPARDRDEPEEDATWYLPPRPEPPPRPPREPRTHAAPAGAGAATAYSGQAQMGRDPDRGGADLPQGDRLGGADRAGRDPAPGRDQRAPAARQVRLAVAVGHRRDHHRHRCRPLGAAEDPGDLPARSRHRELQLHLHAQGVEEHRHLALLVFDHVRHRRPRVGHRGPQPGTGLVDARVRPLPAADPEPPGGRGARPGQRRDRAAPAATAAVRSRRHRGQHDVASDRRAAQLDLSRARLRRHDPAAVLRIGALRPGAEPRVRAGEEQREGHRPADQRGRGAGGADHQEQLHPADGQRARLHPGRFRDPLVGGTVDRRQG